MTNVAYHKIATGSGNQYMNLACGGGPVYFRIQFSDADQLWYVMFTWDGANWFQHQPGNANQATVQTQLDNFIASINAGTVGS